MKELFYHAKIDWKLVDRGGLRGVRFGATAAAAAGCAVVPIGGTTRARGPGGNGWVDGRFIGRRHP